MKPETTTAPATKLFLFQSHFDNWNTKNLLGKILSTFTEMNRELEWGIQVPLPVDIIFREVTFRDETAWLFKDQVRWSYYLVFDRALTEQEVNLWRMFKVGKFTFQH